MRVDRSKKVKKYKVGKPVLQFLEAVGLTLGHVLQPGTKEVSLGQRKANNSTLLVRHDALVGKTTKEALSMHFQGAETEQRTKYSLTDLRYDLPNYKHLKHKRGFLVAVMFNLPVLSCTGIVYR